VLLAGISVPRDPEALEHALEGLVALDAYLIDKYQLPHVTELGARWKREKQEWWRNAIQLLDTKVGDCEDIAGYHAGYLRAHGEPARLILEQTGPNTLHAVVLRADGSIDDPSVWLGMKEPQYA